MIRNARAEKKRRMKEIEGLSDLEYFMRPSFGRYLYSVLSSIISAFRSRQLQFLLYADPEGDTAATNGDLVRVNLLNPFMDAADTRTQKFLIITGMLTHECGHLLFTDFPAMNKFLNEFETSGKLPHLTSSGYVEMMKELEKDAGLVKFTFQYLANFTNVFEDGYIETRLREAFAGIPSLALEICRKYSYKITSGVKEVLEEHGVLEALLVSFLTYLGDGRMRGQIKGIKSAKKAERYEEYDMYLSKIRPFMSSLMYERRSEERQLLVTEVLTACFPLILEAYRNAEKSGSGSGEGEGKASESESKGGSGSGDGKSSEKGSSAKGEPERTPDAEEEEGKAAEALRSLMKSSGVAPMPKEEGSSKPLSESEEERLKRKAYRERAAGSDPVAPDLESTESAAVAELDAERTEKERAALSEDAADLNRTFTICRDELTATSKENYLREYDVVKPIVKRTVRLLNSVLKERNREGKLSGQIHGRVNCRTAYRDDGRIFTRKLEPDGDPQVAFCILIDESGSMNGNREYMARISAICLDAVLREMQVPFCVVGHTADEAVEGEVSVMPYARFDSYDEKDRYRLAESHARSNNHDQAAIRYCGKLLKGRPEKQKVLIVISDGLPWASKFISSSAVRATAEEVKKLSKEEGIEVFGAAIDGCADDVREIYGADRLMDITDIEKLPTELLKVVKRYVLRRQA